MRFAEKLVRAAKDRHLPLKELADRSGINYGTIRNYVAPGKPKRTQGRGPSASHAIALAKALNVAVEWLCDDSETWPPPAYMEPPPFAIYPWPPHGIEWGEVLMLLVDYRMRKLWPRATRALQHLGGSLDPDARRELLNRLHWQPGDEIRPTEHIKEFERILADLEARAASCAPAPRQNPNPE